MNNWLEKFDESKKLIPEIRELLDSSNIIKPHRKMNLSFHAAYALYETGDSRNSLRWLSELADIPGVAYGAAIYYIQGMFLRLIIHMDMDHTDVVEQQAGSFRHFLEARGLIHQAEELFLGVFEKLSRTQDRKERRKIFREAGLALEKLEENSFEFPILNALRFVNKWIRKQEKLYA